MISYTRSEYDIPNKINGVYGAIIEFIKWYTVRKALNRKED
jgi:hypothetical protein